MDKPRQALSKIFDLYHCTHCDLVTKDFFEKWILLILRAYIISIPRINFFESTIYILVFSLKQFIMCLFHSFHLLFLLFNAYESIMQITEIENS